MHSSRLYEILITRAFPRESIMATNAAIDIGINVHRSSSQVVVESDSSGSANTALIHVTGVHSWPGADEGDLAFSLM